MKLRLGDGPAIEIDDDAKVELEIAPDGVMKLKISKPQPTLVPSQPLITYVPDLISNDYNLLPNAMPQLPNIMLGGTNDNGVVSSVITVNGSRILSKVFGA